MNGWKMSFAEKTFAETLPVSPPKDTMPPNFAEKTFTNSYKNTKFSKVFALQSFPLYCINLLQQCLLFVYWFTYIVYTG